MTDGPAATEPGEPGPVVTPEEIQHQEFGVSRFGGYRMRDVDEFLDRLTASTQALQAENERLRSGAAPILGTSDLDDVNRQADEILQRARDEAARIVADASVQAGAAGAPGAGLDRAGVDAFLAQERDFLQRLAALVQGHAEGVKAMAKRSRQAALEQAPPAPEEPDGTEAASPEASEEPTVVPDAGPVEADASEPATGPGGGEAAERSHDEARPAPPRTAPGPRPSGEDAEGDPSLRALFWGDDS